MTFSRVTTFLLLAAITLQAVFGSLQESVVICLGGGHVHESAEVADHCHMECTHHDDWATPTSSDEHLASCDCTDIELGLIPLLTMRRATDHGMPMALLTSNDIVIVEVDLADHLLRGPPPKLLDDPGSRLRLAVIRSTRLIV